MTLRGELGELGGAAGPGAKLLKLKRGPYLSKRQRRTIREDYSESGDVRDCFPHE
jgi:hypothetical protein